METTRFTSRLDTPAARFLSEVVEHAISSRLRTAADFVRHFPPATIMAALAAQPRLRAGLLTVLVGLREKTALRLSIEDAGRLLAAAMEEGDADVEAIAEALDPDDRVRYLDARTLWAFVTEDEFWKVSRSKDPQGHKAAQLHVLHIVDRAMAHRLTSAPAFVEGVTVEVLSEKLPRAELAKVIRAALDLGGRGAAFSSEHLLEASSLAVIVDHVALPHVVDTVILPVARAAGFVAAPSEAPSTGDDQDPVLVAFDRVIAPTAAKPVAPEPYDVTDLAVDEQHATDPPKNPPPVPHAPPVPA